MGLSQVSKLAYKFLVYFVILSLLLINLCLGARKLTSLYQPPPMALKYRNGPLLQGDLPVSILWYGNFSPPQKSIITDFFLSLHYSSTNKPHISDGGYRQPSVSIWWNTIQTYLQKAGKKPTRVTLSDQFSDKNCSLGKVLKKSQIPKVAHRVSPKAGGLTMVLTGHDVAVEGFCMSNCGFHGSDRENKSVFMWVGNSVDQCPGRCAWPFHQPIYGPQTEPLVAPNGDLGADGMVVNIASLLAGALTNPFGNGYYLGPADAPLEAASACPGVYGKGAYPGYAGKVLVDSSSGGSYNALGVNGRKYLLPGLFDPSTSECSTVI